MRHHVEEDAEEEEKNNNARTSAEHSSSTFFSESVAPHVLVAKSEKERNEMKKDMLAIFMFGLFFFSSFWK